MYLVRKKNMTIGVKIIVQPKAKKTQILGLYDGRIKLAVAAPPVDGKANKQMIAFLSNLFGLKKNDITILSGDHSRKKVCLLENIREVEVRNIITPYVDD